MEEEIKFEYKVRDSDEFFSPTIVFKESVTLNTGDELVIVCANGLPIYVAIRRKK